MAAVLMLAAGGAFVAIALTAVAIRRVPERLVRTNVNGHRVAAVLGMPVALAGIVLIAVWMIVAQSEVSARVGGASAGIMLVLAAAGLWDDFRGAELPRGFHGHLDAVRSGRLTGGLVKLAAGGAVGLAAGWLLAGLDHPLELIRIALSIALTANLINLLDRAPGRAGKSALLIGVPLLALGDAYWAMAAAGVLGALVAILPIDLRERGMLGDAGANPLGGVLGLGLALSVPPGPGWAVVAVVAALNLVSERVSFSRVIERNRLLSLVDRAGRKPSDDREETRT
jgi:hypothetical protein